MNHKTDITDKVLYYYGAGWPHDAIACRLGISKSRVDRVVDNMERGFDMDNRPIRKRKVPSKSYDKLPVGSIINVCDRKLVIVLRTSCKHCIVNADRKYSKLCNSKCEKDNRADNNNIIYIEAMAEDAE